MATTSYDMVTVHHRLEVVTKDCDIEGVVLRHFLFRKWKDQFLDYTYFSKKVIARGGSSRYPLIEAPSTLFTHYAVSSMQFGGSWDYTKKGTRRKRINLKGKVGEYLVLNCAGPDPFHDFKILSIKEYRSPQSIFVFKGTWP